MNNQPANENSPPHRICPECLEVFRRWSESVRIGETFVCSTCNSEHVVTLVDPYVAFSTIMIVPEVAK